MYRYCNIDGECTHYRSWRPSVEIPHFNAEPSMSRNVPDKNVFGKDRSWRCWQTKWFESSTETSWVAEVIVERNRVHEISENAHHGGVWSYWGHQYRNDTFMLWDVIKRNVKY